MLYSASTRGFYEPSTVPIPEDAVTITEVEYRALFDGQAQGMEIVPNDKGWPILADTPDFSLGTLKNNLKQEIDALAEAERLKYITPGAGQAMTYQQKVAEARSYSAENDPDFANYPLLSSEVGITAPTFSGVVDVVLNAYSQWQQIGAAIEVVRLRAKRDVDSAESKVDARNVAAAIVWPTGAVAS